MDKKTMVLMRGTLLVALLGTVALNVCFAEEQAVDGPKLAVNKEIDGMQIKVPFFDPEMTTISEARNEWNEQFGNDYIAFVKRANNDLFVKKKSLVAMSAWSKKFYDFFKEKKESLAVLIEKEGGNPDTQKPFLGHLVTLWKDVLVAAKAKAKAKGNGKIKRIKPTKEETQKWLDYFNQGLMTLHNICRASPVRAHINWAQLTLDGVPMVEWASNYMVHYWEATPRGLMPIIHSGTALCEKLV